ncbi:MAG TPA: hypothetical protein DHW71_03490 [Gammaproteobacteria bacterium]|nr:hypothetical protein [Gammaproteobacteria bacterium]MEC8011597.1 response regulator [Pseudomonadota bacterium]HBF08250.1 hypothetical protein [Gammaproteobacteria bacterium]HCK92022.1 hypothetical protein [Gammaproteobacteria bacterium]|tara:strand:+ start:23 stop:433 length:411 start_codon:yes stop_codon:yes gene_type:complete
MSKQIMIVDDSSIMRRVIANVLSTLSNVEVCAQAKNGEHALEMLPTVKPDLILLDIEMPKMNGLDFLRHAKLRTRAKIIVLSSVTDLGSDRAVEALRRGADAIVSKPSGAISMNLEQECKDQLAQAINQVLQGKEG